MMRQKLKTDVYQSMKMISPADLTEEDLKPKDLGVVEDWILADLVKPKKFQKSPRQLKKNHKRFVQSHLTFVRMERQPKKEGEFKEDELIERIKQLESFSKGNFFTPYSIIRSHITNLSLSHIGSRSSQAKLEVNFDNILRDMDVTRSCQPVLKNRQKTKSNAVLMAHD